MKDGALYDAPTRLIHLLIAACGIAAIVSGQFAGDYRRALHPGFDVHGWIGLAMACALGVRIAWGFIGTRAMRFENWRARHPGLAGYVQALGLAAFLWMAGSGAALFFFLEPGARATGWVRALKELHEGGQLAVVGYLAAHVGGTLVHSLLGMPVWQRMFTLRVRT